MVQPEGGDGELDDVILRVFEQQTTFTRHFYFPVTSQRDARAFVCELNRLGVQYHVICTAVGELEANFTSWRTGLSRPSVGNRVVERINRPLQQLLLAADDNDDDDDDDVGLSDVDLDENVLEQFTSSTYETSAYRQPTRRTPYAVNKHDLTTVSHSAHRSSVVDTGGPPASVLQRHRVVCSDGNELNNNDSSCAARACNHLDQRQHQHHTSSTADTQLHNSVEPDLLRTSRVEEVAAGVVAASIDGAVKKTRDRCLQSREQNGDSAWQC